MSKKITKEEKAKHYLKELEEVFNNKEMSYITTIFSVIKRSVGEDYYFDVINDCCEKLLESKQIGLEFEPEDAVRKIYSETGYREDVVPMQTLSQEEQAYSTDRLLCAQITRNRIFNDMLNGKDKKIIAERYSTTEEIIDKIYTDILATYTVDNKNQDIRIIGRIK